MENKTAESLGAVHTHTHTHYFTTNKERRYAYYLSLSPFCWKPLVKEVTI